MKTLLVLCAALIASLGLTGGYAEAYQKDCLASLLTPTWNEGQSVPCSVRLDGGEGMHFLDQLGGEHVDANETLGYLRVAPGIPLSTTAGTAITTDTTSAVYTLPAGAKTPLAKITAAGAQTQTFTIYGAYDNTAANGIELCVITLSVAVKDVKTCDSGAQITKDFPFYYHVTSLTTGSASGELIFYNGLVASGTSSGGAGDASAAHQLTQITALQLIDNIVGVEDAAETAGGGLAMAGTVRRDVAASSAGTTGDNATMNTDALGQLWTRNIDPCSGIAKTFLPFSVSTATTTELTPSLAGASTHYYVCSFVVFPTAGAQTIALADDDSDGCGSVTSGLAGGTTAGTGGSFAANGGIVMGTGGYSVAKTNGTNRVVCLVTGSAVQTSGVISVVAAP